MRDFHVMVIDDIGQVVDRKPVRLEDDRVAFHLQTGMLDRTINEVVKGAKPITVVCV